VKKPGAKKVDDDAIGNYMRSIPRDVKNIIHRGLEDRSGTEIVYVHNGATVRKVFRK
jgi:hypothetical protein